MLGAGDTARIVRAALSRATKQTQCSHDIRKTTPTATPLTFNGVDEAKHMIVAENDTASRSQPHGVVKLRPIYIRRALFVGKNSDHTYKTK